MHHFTLRSATPPPHIVPLFTGERDALSSDLLLLFFYMVSDGFDDMKVRAGEEIQECSHMLLLDYMKWSQSHRTSIHSHIPLPNHSSFPLPLFPAASSNTDRRISKGSAPHYTTTPLTPLRDLDQPFIFDITFYNRPYRFEFYDTASPQHYSMLEPNVIVLCYDISSRLSLINVQRFVSLLPFLWLFIILVGPWGFLFLASMMQMAR